MRKLIRCILFTGIVAVLLHIQVFAATAEIDKSNISNGIAVLKLSGQTGNKIVAWVEKSAEKQQYIIIHDQTNLPLQMGTGDYKITILEGNPDTGKFVAIAAETFTACSIDENEMFKASIPLVDYDASVEAIPAFKEIAAGSDDAIKAVYDEIVANYSYDYDKLLTVKSDYVPVIDIIYEAKKGICYDYSALLSGVLRSMGIPTKLIMGYTPEIPILHAWNEILIGDEWITVDTTYDAQANEAGVAYTMAKNKTNKQILKVY